ncbi:MAG: hypothetical protein C0616_09920 [Desulfuromonas sp.]|nr:MAG: hypothetical protein C0616_09920 [Desulfuromonas sp.]
MKSEGVTMKNCLSVLVLIALLVMPGVAMSAQDSGPYFGIQGGGVLLDDIENKDNEGTYNYSFDPGYYGAVVIGAHLDKHSSLGEGRLEVEVAYRANDLDEMDFEEGSEAAGGEMTVMSAMFNSIAEYRGRYIWVPYLGAGAGWAMVDLKDATVGGQAVADADDNAFCYQFMTGFVAEVSSAVNFDLGYRYMRTLDLEFEDVQGRSVDSEYSSHTVSLGLRIDF